jgi:tellurite resistance protein TerC
MTSTVQQTPGNAPRRRPQTLKRYLHRLAARVRVCLRHLRLGRARKIVVAVIGGTVILVGITMIVLPGPAILVIPLGLAILATEFLWARRWLKRLRSYAQSKTTKSSDACNGRKCR